jgi:hypothetical protein
LQERKSRLRFFDAELTFCLVEQPLDVGIGDGVGPGVFELLSRSINTNLSDPCLDGLQLACS